MLLKTTDEFGNERISIEKLVSALLVIISSVLAFVVNIGWLNQTQVDILQPIWPVLLPLGILWWRQRYQKDKVK